MAVEVPVASGKRLALHALGIAALCALATVYWSARAFGGELLWPSLLFGGIWLVVVAGWLFARRGTIERRLAVVLTNWTSTTPVGHAATRIDRDVTLRTQDGEEKPYPASEAASTRASEGEVGVACIRRGTLVWFERVDV